MRWFSKQKNKAIFLPFSVTFEWQCCFCTAGRRKRQGGGGWGTPLKKHFHRPTYRHNSRALLFSSSCWTPSIHKIRIESIMIFWRCIPVERSAFPPLENSSAPPRRQASTPATSRCSTFGASARPTPTSPPNTSSNHEDSQHVWQTR